MSFPIINSYHYQVINKLGKYIRFSAVAAGGVIEAIEHVESKAICFRIAVSSRGYVEDRF